MNPCSVHGEEVIPPDLSNPGLWRHTRALDKTHPAPPSRASTSILVQSYLSHTPLHLDGKGKRATSKDGTPSGPAVSSCPPLVLSSASRTHMRVPLRTGKEFALLD